MEPIHWHNSFNVGVLKIDSQHRQLFELVNELIHAFNSNQHGDVFDCTLQRVLDYTQMHFSTEEELFNIHPQCKEHILLHKRLVDQMLALSRELHANKADAAKTLLAYLTQWLQGHILNTDISYFADLGYRPRQTREDLEERLKLLNRKEQILVVEDSLVERRLLRANLEKDGFGVLEASNGSEALQILKENLDIHIILTDISMPVMDGFELIQAIRNNQTLAVYLIVLTGSTDKDSLVRAFSIGANDFLTKPVFHPELSLRIRNGLNMLQVQSQDELIFAMAQLADCRSPETGNHLDRVRRFALILGRKLIKTCPGLGMAESIAAEISRFSPLHDIGKVAIADGILNKPGRLTTDEFTIMKEHARIGGELIRKIYRKTGSRSLRIAYELTMHHHEKWNGSGYPLGLMGEDIPVAARIMALVDVYDALTSERVYKKAYSREEARDVILASSGSHFDPLMVETFKEVEGKFHQLRVELQDAS